MKTGAFAEGIEGAMQADCDVARLRYDDAILGVFSDAGPLGLAQAARSTRPPSQTGGP